MENPKADARLLWIALAAIVIVLCVVTNRYKPPHALPANTAPARFSADRGFSTLQRVLTPEAPHATGSAANDAVRGRILAELESLGYTPHVHSAFVCRNGTCGHVRNVAARVRGRQSGNAVMLAVHYDSVLAGPGASDDGQGLATTLEIARALRHRPQPLHDIILLIDDGEEWGLLGAEAFVRDHPWADSVRYAVIVEARGTTGPSLMFETAPGNRRVIDLMAGALERPVTNSIYYSIYKMLPNDTDFTVFKAAGLEGVNFANSFGAARYHTPRDDLAHFDRRTLQHHGDNALAMVIALADSDLAATPAVDAVFFDLLAFQLIRWNEESTPPIAGAALAILVMFAIVLIRLGRMRVSSILWGVGGLLIAVGAAALLGFVMLHFLRASGAAPVNWIARPSAMLIAFWLAPLSGVALSSAIVGRRAGSSGMWVATWIFWAMGGLVLSFLQPGFTYPLTGERFPLRCVRSFRLATS